MLMLNWISSACIELAGQAGPLYVNTKISMAQPKGLFAFAVAILGSPYPGF